MKLMKWGISRLVVLIAAVAVVFTVGPVAIAAAHTCGSDWCSGSDGNSGYNWQGHAPQLYIGEVGTFKATYPTITRSGPCPGSSIPNGACWNTVGANGAWTRYKTGTGMGVWYYYFLYGPGTGDMSGFYSPYCLGWKEGQLAVRDAHNYKPSYYGSAWVMTMDIEIGSSHYGWTTRYQATNREVFDGFTTYVAQHGSQTSHCTSRSTTGNFKFQYEVYSAPSIFNPMFGTTYSSMPGTLKWTAQLNCYTPYPGTRGFVTARWFSTGTTATRTRGTKDMWQFEHYPCGARPPGGPANTYDYDIMYEPLYLPVYGITIGS
jgi:hypothetical protein